jgi:hypothetical protein
MVNPVNYWQEQALADHRVLLGASLFYYAYRDSVRGVVSNDYDQEYFKGRNLYLINQAFEDKSTAVSDENIAAVITICTYEVLFTDSPLWL